MPATGPTSGLPSGVNVNAPFTHRLMPTSCSTGKRANPIESSGMMRSSSSGNSSRPKSQCAPSTSQCRGLLLVHAEQHAVALALQVGEALEVGDGGHVPSIAATAGTSSVTR